MIEFAVGPESIESILLTPPGAVVIGEVLKGPLKRGARFTRAVAGRDERSVSLRIDRIVFDNRVWDQLARPDVLVTLELTGEGLGLLRPHDLLMT